MKVPIWDTADGRSIPVTEMTDSHIANARNLLERMLQNRGFDMHYDPNFEDFFTPRPIARAKKWIAIFQTEQDRRDKEKKDQMSRLERKVDAIAEGQGLLIHAFMQMLGVVDTDDDDEGVEFEPSDALKEALSGLENVESIEEDKDGLKVVLRFAKPKFMNFPRMMFDVETHPFGKNIDANGRTAKGKKTAATIKARRKATTTKVTKDAKRGRSKGRSVRGKAKSKR